LKGIASVSDGTKAHKVDFWEKYSRAVGNEGKGGEISDKRSLKQQYQLAILRKLSTSDQPLVANDKRRVVAINVCVTNC
jgi:hypothetical protein